ncbi:hypothetical protein [Streptomyces sp. NPDC001933]|uniref:hypothetical protein n=1 Tax=Streptomyces sp. NPDC001933 TaxID=3364626 RepID=UPI0036A48D8C
MRASLLSAVFAAALAFSADAPSAYAASETTASDVGGHGDHRLAMAAAVAAAATEGETLITGRDSVATSYPAFVEDLVRLTGAGVTAADDEV